MNDTPSRLGTPTDAKDAEPPGVPAADSSREVGRERDDDDGDPFATFSEWAGEADARAYAGL